MNECPFPRKDEERHIILAWHVFNGTMVTDTKSIRKNRFFMLWQETPWAWVDVKEREPGREDADGSGRVLILDKFGNIRLKSWRQWPFAENVDRWQRLPEAPENFEELRKRWD